MDSERRLVPAERMFRIMAGKRDQHGDTFAEAYRACQCGGPLVYFLVWRTGMDSEGVNIEVAPRCEDCARADVQAGAKAPAD